MHISIKKQLAFLMLSNIVIMLAILSVSAYLYKIVERVRQNQAAADQIVKVVQQARIAEKAYRQHYIDEYRHIVIQKTDHAKNLLPKITSNLKTEGQDQIMHLILSYEDIFADMIGFHDRNETLTREIQETMAQVQAMTKTFMDTINERQFNARTLYNSVLDQMELGLLSPLHDINYFSIFLLLSHQRFLSTNNPQHLSDFNSYFDEYSPGILGAITQGSAYLDNNIYQGLIDKIKTDLKIARHLLERSQELMNIEENKVLQLDQIGNDLEIQTQSVFQMAIADSSDAKLNALKLGILILITGSGLMVSISLYLIRSITNPLETLVNASNVISKGDLSFKIPNARHNNEFTKLGTAFNNMIRNLSQALARLETEISDRRHAEKKLKKLSHRIILNQEMERTALARELHDEVGQVLTALKIDAVWIKKNSTPANSIQMKRIEQMCNFIDKSFDDIKSLALRLRPKVLDDMGLSIALRWLCADFQTRNRVKCKVEVQDLEIKNDIASTALYRIAQESLTNVMRHAQASKVTLSLNESNSGEVVLTVEDNGKGFDQNRIKDREALGMAGMIERAELIGADFAVESFPGNGCKISLRMLNPNMEEKAT